MSEIENTLPNENPPVHPAKIISKTERMQDMLLVIAAAQIVLALLLYLFASTTILLLLAEAAVTVALALFSRFKFEKRAPRIVLRILCITLAVTPFLLAITVLLPYYSEAIQYRDTAIMHRFQADLWMMVALIILPPLLFLQPVYTLNATARRRFDMVLLRILSIITLICTIILCVFAFDFQTDGVYISTSLTVTPPFLGEYSTFTIAIDNIFTRILFCACSAVMVFCSFFLRSEKYNSQ